MIIIKNSRILNPKTNEDFQGDILIEEGKITRIDRDISLSDARVIDASGMYAFPGFIDLHVHLRDPGQTYKEDIVTGTRAAARGGYTTVCCMPNTSPVVDSVETVRYIVEKARDEGSVNVLPIAAITKGMEGRELTDIRALVEAGACGISEDGKSVMDAALLLEAMTIAKELDIPVMSHCEDKSLMGGVMNFGSRSQELGLPGMKEVAEDVIAMRDILLARESGARLHLCHNSTALSYHFINFAKAQGVNITAEICPHHFTLSDQDIPDGDSGNYKMSPPLRSPETVDVLRTGLCDGTYYTIATDHAPHSAEEKSRGFTGSPFGIVGLETAASLAYTELVKTGLISPLQMAERMSYGPARVLGIDKGEISVGKVADITLFDPNLQYEIHGADFAGKSTNMPYEGREVTGKVKVTIVDGKIVYED